MEFDVQQLSTEIRRIDAEYRETLQRYLEVSGGRRGRGRGRRGRFNQRQGSFRRFSPPQEVLSEQVPSEGPMMEEPRLASAIAGVAGNERDFGPGISQRPGNRAIEEEPRMKDRNRRMFSSLLGTLEKFREENDSVEKSERWRKREEISKRAIQKTTEESLRLLEQKKKDRQERRTQETERMSELESMRKTKRLQLIYAKRVQHQELLLNFVQTSVLPVILWVPAKHNTETQALVDSNGARHEEWLHEQQQNFEKEKIRMETGEGLGDESVRDCGQQTEATMNDTKQATVKQQGEEDELPAETEELQFQPVSEMHIPMEEEEGRVRGSTANEAVQTDPDPELPPAKKQKLEKVEVSESEEK